MPCPAQNGERGVTNGVRCQLLLFVVPTEEDGPTDTDLPSWGRAIGIVPHFLIPLQAELCARDWRPNCTGMACAGQCQEGRCT